MSTPVSAEGGFVVSVITFVWALWVCYDEDLKWTRWLALALVYLNAAADGCALAKVGGA